MLAEAVSIDGGVLLLILVVFVLLFVLWCALVTLGCRWARRAGQGSRRALAGWAVVAVLEVLPFIFDLTPLLLVPLGVLALQARLFIRAKAEATAGDPE
jgi:hypothetical protein